MKKLTLIATSVVLILAGISILIFNLHTKQLSVKAAHEKQLTTKPLQKVAKQIAKQNTNVVKQEVDEARLWNKPTDGNYPTLSKSDWQKVHIDVSTEKQRVYLKKGNQIIYTMICSTGDTAKGMATPKGHFKIQPERGVYFTEPQTGTCYNWVSFLHHGEYLFHSIPMKNKAEVNETEARKFGHPASHGCVRLSLPDSKWFFEHIQTGTAVHIQ